MTVAAENITVRDANEHDVDFLAWVMLAASRSHLTVGCWEYKYNADATTVLRFLRRLALTDQVHPFHFSVFQIADVDGEPASALCGFDPATQGVEHFMAVATTVREASGIFVDEDFTRRVQIFKAAWPGPGAERPWVIENVATRPEFRRRGLCDLLLRHTLDRGRLAGFEHAQIGIYIGNEVAKRAYVNAGFTVVGEARDRRWDAELGCPGTEVLLRPI